MFQFRPKTPPSSEHRFDRVRPKSPIDAGSLILAKTQLRSGSPTGCPVRLEQRLFDELPSSPDLSPEEELDDPSSKGEKPKIYGGYVPDYPSPQ